MNATNTWLAFDSITGTLATGSYTTGDIFSMYSDGTTLHYQQNGIVIATSTIDLTNPYNAHIGCGVSVPSAPLVVSNVRYYPTGKCCTGGLVVGGVGLIFWADQTQSTINGVLSDIYNYQNIIKNVAVTITNNGVPGVCTLTLPTTGSYIIEISGWRCGSGNGQARVVADRGGTIVYDRKRIQSYQDCSIFTSRFMWNGFQAGDVLTLYKNHNTTGGFTPSIDISSQDDEWGYVAIYSV
jgi:hypothetical protein